MSFFMSSATYIYLFYVLFDLPCVVLGIFLPSLSPMARSIHWFLQITESHGRIQRLFPVFPGILDYFDTLLCIYVYILIYVCVYTYICICIMLYVAVFSLIAA
jgi:hypothetical protein